MTADRYTGPGDTADPPRLMDDMAEFGENRLWCSSCGERLWPDCDVSRVSINECWQDHLVEAHPTPQEPK